MTQAPKDSVDAELDEILYDLIALNEISDMMPLLKDPNSDPHVSKAKQQLKALLVKARQSELEMFKKVPVESMSSVVTAHISRRYKKLESELNTLTEQKGKE